jgi:tRNA-dihydrouridine synthase
VTKCNGSVTPTAPELTVRRVVFAQCKIRERHLCPARFSTPLAGFTHSAFRRLLADFGGCGAVWTEMLAGPQILVEDFRHSPWLRRTYRDPLLVYQLMLRDGDPIERILARMGEHGVEAIDLNLACDALSIRACEAGSALFENLGALRSVVRTTRQLWPGLLFVKIRLGSRGPDWGRRLVERLLVLTDEGVDAITVHPRFFEEKFKRRARLELVPWLRSLTTVPLIANGDLRSAEQVTRRATDLKPACAIMIGRMAVAQPWIFAAWHHPPTIDVASVWATMADYLLEDFPPDVALRRLKMFTKYYAANFVLGHRFRVSIQNASSWEKAHETARSFFDTQPALLPDPIVAGL